MILMISAFALVECARIVSDSLLPLFFAIMVKRREVVDMKFARLLVPNVENFGFALFLSISATSIWGGVYPYLMANLQMPSTTAWFYIVQMTSFCATFGASLLVSYRKPQGAWRAHAVGFTVPLVIGPLLLISAMYLETIAFPLIIASAVLIGIGLAGFLFGWQVVFASQSATTGNLALATGTGYSALLYFGLCLIPAALTSYLIPLMLSPLEGLCLWLSAQNTDWDQPMFQDVPQKHPLVYKNAIRESLYAALMVGALGFCAGAIRFIAILHQNLMSDINIISMFALLVVVCVFIAVWQFRNIRFELMDVYRILFPITATCLLVLPFAGSSFTNVGSAACYACFMMATTLVMMHCGQISRDSGINPLFIYSFFGVIVYLFQTLGYLFGYVSGIDNNLGVEQFSLVSLGSLYVLLVVTLLGRKQSKLHTTRLEFLMISPQSKTSGIFDEIEVARELEQQPSKEKPREGPEVTDRVSKQCQILSSRYGLSSREAEVMEMLARGYSGPAIAQELFISENTVRTHSKRIYAKLDIHKKQELLDLLKSTPAQAE